jgi:hypothetical protein
VKSMLDPIPEERERGLRSSARGPRADYLDYVLLVAAALLVVTLAGLSAALFIEDLRTALTTGACLCLPMR